MPDVPKSAKQPQDHKDKSAAQQDEATESNPVIEFNGESYEVLTKRVNTVGFMNMVKQAENGAFYLLPDLVQKMIGDEAWARFMEANYDPDLDDVSGDTLEEFFDAMNEASGNQPASSGS